MKHVSHHEEHVKEISQHWQGQVRVQGGETLEKIKQEVVTNTAVTVPIKNKLSGDGEIHRKPWKVNKSVKKGKLTTEISELDTEDVTAELAYVLTGIHAVPTQTKEKAIIPEQKSPECSLIVKFLRDIPNSNKAVSFAEKLDQLPCATLVKIAGVPQAEVLSLAAMVGLGTEEEVMVKFRLVIEVLLQGWRDVVQAEQQAFMLL